VYVNSDPIHLSDPSGLLWRQAERLGQKLLRYGRRLTRGEALTARMAGKEVVTDSTRAAKKLDENVSRAVGGCGSAVCERPHEPGQLTHSHAEIVPGGARFAGHTFIDSELVGLVAWCWASRHL